MFADGIVLFYVCMYVLISGDNSAKYILEKMEQSEEGSRILKDRPRILSKTVDLEKLKKYPVGTLGKAYSTFLEVNVSILFLCIYFVFNT